MHPPGTQFMRMNDLDKDSHGGSRCHAPATIKLRRQEIDVPIRRVFVQKDTCYHRSNQCARLKRGGIFDQLLTASLG